MSVGRLVLRGAVHDPTFPVRDLLAETSATQYGKVLGVAIRDFSRIQVPWAVSEPAWLSPLTRTDRNQFNSLLPADIFRFR